MARAARDPVAGPGGLRARLSDDVGSLGDYLSPHVAELARKIAEVLEVRGAGPFTTSVMRLVLQWSFRRSRQPLRLAMACSPRQRILAWLVL